MEQLKTDNIKSNTDILEKCQLCPRKCKVNRTENQKGFCGQTQKVCIARAALHYWEEPCISGKNGSGAIFFSGCQLKCVFCQNREISEGAIGKEITCDRLAEIMWELKEQGANNINLVTPTQFIPQIAYVLKHVRAEGFPLPVVYNTSSYENVEALRLLEGLVDIYLPDAKYYDSELALRYSHASDYPDVAKKAIAEMVRQIQKAGGKQFDDSGIMKKGIIVRHLVLPGHTNDSKKVIEDLFHTYHNEIFISIMNQYTPMGDIEFTELNRKVTKREYQRVVDFALQIGLENGFIQEGDTQKESFIPDFNYEGVEK